jgi:hypothetical protein
MKRKKGILRDGGQQPVIHLVLCLDHMKVLFDWFPHTTPHWIELCCYLHLSVILEAEVTEPENLSYANSNDIKYMRQENS